VAASFPFFVESYGVGRNATHEISNLDEAERVAPRYLLNHGKLTPVSDWYYYLRQWTTGLALVLWIAGFPLGLAGLAHYASLLDWTRLDTVILLWLALFVPVRHEPAILVFAKTWFLLTFVGLGVFLNTSVSACHEGTFVERIAACYALTGAVSCAVVEIPRRAGYLASPGQP
jgi:hypothetical protein